MVKVFANGLRDWGLIPGWVIPKIQKMVLVASELNTQHYKVQIKGEQSNFKERSSTLLYPSASIVATEKGAFKLPSTTVGQQLIDIDI